MNIIVHDAIWSIAIQIKSRVTYCKDFHNYINHLHLIKYCNIFCTCISKLNILEVNPLSKKKKYHIHCFIIFIILGQQFESNLKFWNPHHLKFMKLWILVALISVQSISHHFLLKYNKLFKLNWYFVTLCEMCYDKRCISIGIWAIKKLSIA